MLLGVILECRRVSVALSGASPGAAARRNSRVSSRVHVALSGDEPGASVPVSVVMYPSFTWCGLYTPVPHVAVCDCHCK